jgi:manganese/zinc/iron transport system substrate-binding protein
MKRPLIAAITIALSLLILPGCGNGNNGEKEPDILCTTNVVGDVVRQVAGDHFTVGVLMGDGKDPHGYEPTSSDMRALRNAKIVFYSGLHLEGKMTELLEEMGSKKPVVAVAETLDDARILRDEGTKTPDPHVWFDLKLWSGTADAVAEALTKQDQKHAKEYRDNARKYREKLLTAHAELIEEMKQVPEEQRWLVTAHDAFEYFGRAYGIKVRAVQGISTEDKAGLKEINDLVEFLVSKKIKAIFVETSVSDKNVKALVEGCHERKHPVKIGGELFSDSIGAEGTPEGTLEGAVRANVRTIVNALK